MAYDPISSSFEEAHKFDRSPFVQSFLAGTKGALLGGPLAAGIQALRGKSATTGAVVGALGAGLAAGLAKAVERKMENLNQEAVLRYHAEQILSREPYFFMPPPVRFGQLFTGFHNQAHGLRYPVHGAN